MPLASNCIDSRLHVVVFPDDDGPASNMSFTPFRLAISSAMRAIFFSCKASDTLMSSVAFPSLTISLKSPMVRTPMMSCQRWCSLNISNILSWCVISGSTPGFFRSGMRSSSPSKYFSNPKR